jgi:hypothetical protein
LVLRSAGRIVLSVSLALAGAATITVLLPFHELNSEISARTTPTVLDLLTAAFCALAGVYASLRPGSDTATTAAGTSIGISLVPPLCASGYGLGTLVWPVAGGAALLFLTNLVAIVAVGTVTFVAAGFNAVDVLHLERDVLATGGDAPFARWLASRLSRLFESRVGPVLRFFMPFMLLAAVYVPLRRALDEVAWEVKARKAVRDSLAQEPLRVVESRSQVARHGVELVVVVLGTAKDADAARARLTARVKQASGIKPKIEVLAVPDATAFAGLESTLLSPRPAIAAPEPSSLAAQALKTSDRLRAALAEIWPAGAAGEILSIATQQGDDASLLIRIAHWGQPIDAAAREALQKSLSKTLEGATSVETAALTAQPITRREGDLVFIARATAAARAARPILDVGVCLTRPDVGEAKFPLSAQDRALARALDAELASQQRLTTLSGSTFELQLTRGACAGSNSSPIPAGSNDESAAGPSRPPP